MTAVVVFVVVVGLVVVVVVVGLVVAAIKDSFGGFNDYSVNHVCCLIVGMYLDATDIYNGYQGHQVLLMFVMLHDKRGFKSYIARTN